MIITVNGEPRDLADGASVTDLLARLGFDPAVTVVERNADIVERATYGDTTLAEGDVLELVRFVGGG